MSVDNMETAPEHVSDRLQLATEQWERESSNIAPKLFQFISAISMLYQQVQIDFRELTQKLSHDIGVGDLRILFVLRRSGPTYRLRAVDLRHYLLITSGAVTKQIARLESKGLIIRSRSKARRGWSISLTDLGREIADEAILKSGSPSSACATAFLSLDEQEQADGIRFLRRVVGRMEKARAGDEDEKNAAETEGA